MLPTIRVLGRIDLPVIAVLVIVILGHRLPIFQI
jgi:hypothetical protein